MDAEMDFLAKIALAGTNLKLNGVLIPVLGVRKLNQIVQQKRLLGASIQ